MHIRPARLDEVAAVGDLTVAAYQEWLEGERDPHADHLRNAEARLHEAEVLVAVDQDDRTLLGTVTICPEGSAWREIGLADEGEFRMLAVAPESRGRGPGGRGAAAAARLVPSRPARRPGGLAAAPPPPPPPGGGGGGPPRVLRVA